LAGAGVTVSGRAVVGLPRVLSDELMTTPEPCRQSTNLHALHDRNWFTSNPTPREHATQLSR
jgi:hypothetical protein